ncbi:hypothetical protein [Agrococcus sp. SGAir0287]|uniref:hypothetical protein n=1 Tax=Agrococcus sp. SGAir0287 TaxID=2070347 RepID=UPI0010F97F08|nr:hypothetical protein [Agrococcus sp. SGAir0287]
MLSRALAPSSNRQLTRLAPAAIAALTLVALTACSTEPEPLAVPQAPTHIHDVAFSADGTLLVGTHTGVLVTAPGEPASLLGDTSFDAMGLVATSDAIHASGHPSASTPEFAYPNVGLLTFDGDAWTTTSPADGADFHALAAGDADPSRLVGLRSDSPTLQITADGGASWSSGAALAARDLVVDDGDPDVVLATTADGPVLSVDGGATFGALPEAPLLVVAATAGPGAMIGVDPDGTIWRAEPRSATWQEVGTVEPGVVAIAADDGADTLAIAYESSALLSTDAGATWSPVELTA